MPSSQSSVIFTDAAASKLREYVTGQPGKGLRIFLDNGAYALCLDEPEAVDTVFDYEGFSLVVDAESMKYVVGLIVDFVEDGEGGTFELSNAFSKDGGCGEGKGSCGCNKGAAS